MIRKGTIEAAFPLAQLLADKGIEVTPIEETPVAKLLNAGTLNLPTRGVDENAFPVEERILKASRAAGPEGVIRHDEVMSDLVEVISATVRGNLDMARNVVNPIVKEVVQDTEEFVQNSIALKSTHIQIKPVFLPNVFNSSLIEDMVKRFDGIDYKDVDLTLSIPHDTDRESLLELAKTGADAFDNDLKDICSKMSDEDVAYAYNAVFGANPTLRARRLADVVSVNGRPEQALLTHLFARKLINEVPEGVNIGLEEYRAYIATILAQSGRAIVAIMARREADKRMNRLILSYPNPDRLGQELLTITVSGDVYNRWLSEGGSPEAIFGDFITTQNKGYKAILDQKDFLENEWAKREKVLTTRIRLEKFNFAVEGIALALSKQITEIDSEVLPVPKAILHQRLKVALGGLYGKFYDDLFVYARKLVCEVMFPHTNALEILCAIDNTMSDFPEMDIREAALIATIEVVSNWVAKLCKLENVGVQS